VEIGARSGSRVAHSAALPALLPKNPLLDIQWAIQQLDAVRFTMAKEAHSNAVYEFHLFQI